MRHVWMNPSTGEKEYTNLHLKKCIIIDLCFKLGFVKGTHQENLSEILNLLDDEFIELWSWTCNNFQDYKRVISQRNWGLHHVNIDFEDDLCDGGKWILWNTQNYKYWPSEHARHQCSSERTFSKGRSSQTKNITDLTACG